MNNENSSSKFTNWVSKSLTIKVLLVMFLMLILLIPASMIRSVINERQNLSFQATQEVSQKWAERQQLHGPILTIPYEVIHEVDDIKKVYQRQYHVLPEQLDIDVQVNPQELYRGIYKVIVYESQSSISGFFKSDINIDEVNVSNIYYDKAFLTLGVSDLRGIEDNVKFNFNNAEYDVQPGSRITNLIASGVSIPVDISDVVENGDSIWEFSTQLNLKGSQNFSFIPVGATSTVNINSSWADPSFVGNFLPDDREVREDGFEASWKVLQLNRSFPQRFTGDHHGHAMRNAEFGVDFIITLDDYQKSIRSVKYAGMTIALTFLIFFLIEILNKRKIHPLQYILVGLALVLFYILLVALTEHLHFNYAFGISALAIVGMIGLYSKTIFPERKHSVLLILCLAMVYGFLFTTLQLQDYALLLGCIGLFITLSLTMYYTRKIDWYDY